MKITIKTEGKLGKCSWVCQGKKYLKEDIKKLERDGYKIISAIDKYGNKLTR